MLPIAIAPPGRSGEDRKYLRSVEFVALAPAKYPVTPITIRRPGTSD